MSMEKAFKTFKKRNYYSSIVHYPDCKYANQNRSVPVSEEMCECYEKRLFSAGYAAGKAAK